MTIIAWDGNMLAADGLLVHGSSISSTQCQKIFRASEYPQDTWLLNNQKIAAFGLCGDMAAVHHILDALNDGMSHVTTFPAHLSFDAILITEQGDIWMLGCEQHQTACSLNLIDSPFAAVGNGADCAQAVMISGQRALEAVMITMDCNVYCGGNVQLWTPLVVEEHGAAKLITDENESPWYEGTLVIHGEEI